jgi:hypothetical protein
MKDFQNGKPYPPDEVCNPNWDMLLKVFHAINPKDIDAKDKYAQLKDLSLTKTMTEHQYEGIIARCNWQIYLIDNPDEAKKLAEQATNNMKYGAVPAK